MKLKGTIQKRAIMILNDSGRAHNFLDSKLAREAKLPLVLINPAPVTVADGRKLSVNSKCEECEWNMQGIGFQFTFRVLKLGDYDVILGVDWMRAHNPLTFDFVGNILVVHKGGK